MWKKVVLKYKIIFYYYLNIINTFTINFTVFLQFVQSLNKGGIQTELTFLLIHTQIWNHHFWRDVKKYVLIESFRTLLVSESSNCKPSG